MVNKSQFGLPILAAFLVTALFTEMSYADPLSHTITEHGVDWTFGGVAGEEAS